MTALIDFYSNGKFDYSGRVFTQHACRYPGARSWADFGTTETYGPPTAPTRLQGLNGGTRGAAARCAPDIPPGAGCQRRVTARSRCFTFCATAPPPPGFGKSPTNQPGACSETFVCRHTWRHSRVYARM